MAYPSTPQHADGRLRVLLAQLPVPNNPATNVPLAAGYLKAYALARGLLGRAQVDILPRALADHAGDALLEDWIAARAPQVLGLSLYTWNSQRSLELARRLKVRLPGLLVLVGGPEVQCENEWVLRHPGLDLAAVGEGEQTFAALLELWADAWERRGASGVARPWHAGLTPLYARVAGVVLRDDLGHLLFGPERIALGDLAGVPSPYLEGHLEVAPGDMLMVEVSRWCPYACSFCLYGRNMGPRLGSRYFGLERLLAEIRWGLERGVTRVHFIEANLNLVPIFRPLMAALAELNADGRLALYAELRGEHLTEESVAALARAGLKVAEVGLQTANPVALRAAQRRTDLRKWAAGTRLLYQHGVEVLLDVILGLPEDDAAGVAETLDFIAREQLGPYDVFTLQVLPGTAVRQQAAERGLVFQARPPYYVLATDRLDYAALRRLRRRLKRGAGLDPDAVDGCPEPRARALERWSAGAMERWSAGATERPSERANERTSDGALERWSDRALERLSDGALERWSDRALERVSFLDSSEAVLDGPCERLATHVDVLARWEQHGPLGQWLARAAEANPSSLLDLYLLGGPPAPEQLRAWRAALPFRPGYLDRVAVYRAPTPEPDHQRVSPRVWLVLDWSAQLDPDDYAGVAELIWRYPLAPGEEPPLAAWRAAGGAGVLVPGASPEQAARWQEQAGLRVWVGG